MTKARALFADAFQQMNSFHMHITSTSTSISTATTTATTTTSSTSNTLKYASKPPRFSEISDPLKPRFSEKSSSLINLCLFDVRDRRQGTAID